MDIRYATADDLDFLVKLEELSFVESRRFDEAAIKHSILSKHQNLYILSEDGVPCASATIHLYAKSWRIYSIAVMPEYRKRHLGKALLSHIIDEAQAANVPQITLEADSADKNLLQWYESFGFRTLRKIKNFYGKGEHADKMFLTLINDPKINHGFSNVVVVDQPVGWLEGIEAVDVVTAEEFINDERFQTAKDLRIFNLCSSYEYQTIGYYVSLLASARNLRAIPNVATIEDFTNKTVTESLGDEVEDLIQSSFKHIKKPTITIRILFGKTTRTKYQKLSHALYKLFEAPLLECTFEKNRRWHLIQVTPLTLKDIEYTETVERLAEDYFNQKSFTTSSLKNYKYDLAILVEPGEAAPPSGKTALDRFKIAAEKIGFYTEFITKEDFARLTQFDALFIRATTNVNDFTYQFSRYAYAEGLMVIDDPWSILKCSNKLYFHESMKVQGVLTPKTLVVSKTTRHPDIIKAINFPIVLKQPDSACSLGVFKVYDEAQLSAKLKELFKTGDLILAQEYVQSSFDWRVGILDNKPLYACKYYMAKNHWQIYNWHAKTEHDQVGNVDTFLVEDAPKEVLDAAIRAASVMGDGFYGVDLKQANGKVYVIEVNDNPSVDHHWEDKALGDELYLMIMKNFMARIESARNVKQRVLQNK